MKNITFFIIFCFLFVLAYIYYDHRCRSEYVAGYIDGADFVFRQVEKRLIIPLKNLDSRPYIDSISVHIDSTEVVFDSSQTLIKEIYNEYINK